MGIENFVKKLNKDAGKSVISRGNEIPDRLRIPTGSLSLDAELFGGVAKGTVTALVGLESTGKSVVAMKIAAEHQRTFPDEDILWIDAEGAYDPIWSTALGMDVAAENFYVMRPEYMEEAYNAALTAVEEGVGLVVIDSLAALTPKAEAEADMEAMTIGLAARINRKMLRKFQSAANDPNSILPSLIYINHLNEDTQARVMPGMPRPHSEPGGRALRFFPSIKIELKSGETFPKPQASDEDVQPKGKALKFYVTKNKTSPPFRRGHFWFYFDTLDENRTKGSYDRLEEAIRYGIKYGVVVRINKSTYGIPDPDTGELLSFRGKPALVEHIRGSEPHRLWIESEVVRRVKEGLISDGAPVSEDAEEETDEQGAGG